MPVSYYTRQQMDGMVEFFMSILFMIIGYSIVKPIIESNIGSTGSSKMLPQVLIKGGEPVPPEYYDLMDLLIDAYREPLPEYSLQTEPSQPERKIDIVLNQLRQGIESIQNSETFRQMLLTMSKFHSYSVSNIILIYLQKPNATYVAGFNTWKELGRWVKRGEKGISILAPVMPPRPNCTQCGARIPRGARYCPECGAPAPEESELSPVYFKVVSVFDISQTEGKPLPQVEVPTLSGEANEELFTKVMALAELEGLKVSFDPRPDQDPQMKGELSGMNIWIKPDEPRAQQLKTLLHELAHYYTEDVLRLSSTDAETIAESVAYVVAAHYGFDTGVRSFPYVAVWSRDRKVLDKNLTAIKHVSTVMLDKLGG